MQRSGNVYTLFPALCDPKDGKPSCYAYWRDKALRRGDNALSEVTERLGARCSLDDVADAVRHMKRADAWRKYGE